MKALLAFLKGKWLKHPLHPILAHVPVAAWPAALLFDALSHWHGHMQAMPRLAFYSIAFGLAAALLAVPTGLADWSSIKKDNPAWKIGLYHMAMNLVAAVLFAINFGLRVNNFQEKTPVGDGPMVLSAIGTVLVFVSGYLGGLMSYDYGIGVARLSKSALRHRAEAGQAHVAEKK